MKAIILAGGTGSRLWPLTKVVSKQLLPVYDKPMIYYPLTTLMLGGIQDILVITTPQDEADFKELLGDGSQWGIHLRYAAQPHPGGLAQSFIIGRHFIGSDPCGLILGDNIFHGHELTHYVQQGASLTQGAHIYTYPVRDPHRYGVCTFGPEGTPTSIVEKPSHPTSFDAVTGLYFYDSQVVEIAASLKPSARGELEITDVNNYYLTQGNLSVTRLGRGYAWLDAGTPESLLNASNFIQTIENRQGFKIACPEEIAFRMGFIGYKEMEDAIGVYKKTEYGEYLQRALQGMEGEASSPRREA